MIYDSFGFPHKFLWKIKVPAKIKFFSWLVGTICLLTKDNLLKRGWHGCDKCVFVVVR